MFISRSFPPFRRERVISQVYRFGKGKGRIILIPRDNEVLIQAIVMLLGSGGLLGKPVIPVGAFIVWC